MKFFSAFLLSGLLTGSLLMSGCSHENEPDPSIANIAVANPAFSVLKDAAVRGGVVEVLSNKNPADAYGKYTVFAPTNDAFARLGLRSAADLLVLQKPFLTNTLYYHVTGGTLAGTDLRAGLTSPSALGPARRIVERGGSLYVNGARIVATDVRAANGTVHAVDKVLLATGADIVQSAVALSQAQVFTKPELTYLVEAVVYCNLQGALSGPGPFTVFAPTDQAFIDLGNALGVQLTQPSDLRRYFTPADLTPILLNHVISGEKFTSELPENTSVSSLGGAPVVLGPFAAGTLTVKGRGNSSTPANMVIPDVQCTNGIVHVVDRVILP